MHEISMETRPNWSLLDSSQDSRNALLSLNFTPIEAFLRIPPPPPNPHRHYHHHQHHHHHQTKQSQIFNHVWWTLPGFARSEKKAPGWTSLQRVTTTVSISQSVVIVAMTKPINQGASLRDPNVTILTTIRQHSISSETWPTNLDVFFCATGCDRRWLNLPSTCKDNLSKLIKIYLIGSLLDQLGNEPYGYAMIMKCILASFLYPACKERCSVRLAAAIDSGSIHSQPITVEKND